MEQRALPLTRSDLAAEQVVLLVLVFDVVVLSLPAVGLAAVDGALAGGAALRHRAVRAARGSWGLVLVLFGLGGWGGGGEADGHEEGGAEE